jgi:hypothetical protein
MGEAPAVGCGFAQILQGYSQRIPLSVISQLTEIAQNM